MIKKQTLLQKLNSVFSKQPRWEKIEYFDETWENRVAQMAEYISPEKSVMDLGCGKMYLRKYLKNNLYYPVDYTKRDENCIVCDFNKRQFPVIKTDIAFISGCLEYIKPYEWFISSICKKSDRVILSYCTIDEFPTKNQRKSFAWANHLSKANVIDQFKKNYFTLIKSELTKTNNSIFVFDSQ